MSWQLCRSCYEYERREGRLHLYRRKDLRKAPKPYYEALIEELEFGGWTWSDLERQFKRDRRKLTKVLRSHGRLDLVKGLR